MAGITTANDTDYPLFDEDTDPLHTPLDSEVYVLREGVLITENLTGRNGERSIWQDSIVVAEDGEPEGWILIDGTYSPRCHIAAR